MKNKHLSLIILFLLCCLQSALATDVVIDELKYSLDESTKTATVIRNSSSKYQGDIVIPSTVSYNGDVYNVTTLGDNAFYFCDWLTSITIPEGVTLLGNSCFFGCSGLTSINIPESVTSLGEYCFFGCSSLTSINIPESVTSLGGDCFFGCSSLTSINIPESVTSLGGGCFRRCSNLTTIACKAVSPPSTGSRVFENTSIEKLYVPSEAIEQYKTTSPWSDIANIYSFIEQIDLPSSVILSPSSTYQLNVSVKPTSADGQALNWTSSDENVATVDQSGNLTPPFCRNGHSNRYSN